MAWGPTMTVQTGLSPEIAGAFSGLNSLIGLPAALIVPTIISNMTKRMRQMFISGISALGVLGYVLLLHQVGSFWYWLVVNLLIGISTSVLFPYLMSTFSLKTDSPMQTAELSGMSQSGGYLLAALGPALFGYAYGWFHSWQPQLIVALVMFALMIVSIVIVERQYNIF